MRYLATFAGSNGVIEVGAGTCRFTQGRSMQGRSTRGTPQEGHSAGGLALIDFRYAYVRSLFCIFIACRWRVGCVPAEGAVWRGCFGVRNGHVHVQMHCDALRDCATR